MGQVTFMGIPHHINALRAKVNLRLGSQHVNQFRVRINMPPPKMKPYGSTKNAAGEK